MAKYVLTYTPDGEVKKELTYKGETFSYTMIPDEFGKTGDNKCFDIQVSKKFPDEPDEVIEALENISFADEDEIEECLTILTDYED
ncbi:hypothetical protein MXL46_11325 [Heyndrickxia sporothermodurans]|uniref:hypothetical protein n=1 Tax=Heyndrickxia sporothermodurans TaxID=46224 RepID=UPI002DB6C275|nr:hypothetical protein [Heyndrickxia sporothermodurans]MEB6549677.1 hypothetical protein [Heyndrickxia sporothermodurans]